MTRTRICIALLLSAFVFTLASAQTLDDILQKYYAAGGGLDNMKAINTMKTSGKMMMVGGMEAKFIGYVVRPNSVRQDVVFQGMSAIEAYDGTTPWTVNPFMGSKDAEVMPKEQADDFIEEADIDGPLIDFATKGYKVELAGKEDVEGSEAYKINVTMKTGKVRSYYVDADSYLIIKSSQKVTRNGQEISVDSFPGNYKKVGNVMLPYSFDQKVNGKPAMQMTIDTILVNPVIDRSIFVMPVAAKK
jgi:hypothetical protein